MSILIAVLIALATSQPEPSPAQVVWVARGEFCEPETVLPLPDDTLLVSNVCGFDKPGNGFLTLLDKDGNALDWRVVSELDAPLGMALTRGQLYVVDMNRVRIFRWPGFEPLSEIALETKVANDIAVGDDDSIYVTDSARGEVVVISPELEQSVLTGEPQFPGANGIHVNNDDLWVGGGRLWHVDLRDNAVTTIGPLSIGGIDGIEQESDGTLQVTPVAGPLIRLTDEYEVLIVDDSSIARKRVCTLISDSFDCDFACNGREAVEAYGRSVKEERRYDLVTLDINMPEMNGHETIVAIRNIEKRHGLLGLDGVKIIMTTTESGAGHVFPAFKEG